ncbi:MAG: exo-alpha-sialidase [Gammaproteobacteria bacterium]|nr:exo-alpha-sialidase [Gammaproteobacteria bacterium]
MDVTKACAGLLLTISVACGAVAAEHDHAAMAPSADSPCQDSTQPASLRCGLTPSSVFDSRGRLWLVWVQGGHVYLNRSDDRGRTFSAPVAVNRTPEKIAAHGENRPKIALGPEGQLYVSWTQTLEKRFTGHIRFARSLDGGRSFDAPLTVNDDHAEIGHRFESLVVDDAGRIFLAWLDKRDQAAAQRSGKPYRGAALYYAWSDDAGRSFKANRKLRDSSCECCRIVSAVDPDGNPAFLWRHVFGDNIRDHALVTFAGPEQPGETVRVTFDEWQVDACPHHGPALAIDAQGIYHMAWYNNAAQRHGLFYAFSRDAGRTLSEPMSFGNYAAAAGHPSVLARDGRVYLLWQEFDGAATHLKLMQSSEGGRQWSPARDVAHADGEVDYPFLVADAMRVYAAWQTHADGYRLIPLDEAAHASRP